MRPAHGQRTFLLLRELRIQTLRAQHAENRMGSGKGSPEYWVAVVKPGRVLFEIKGVSEEVAREALRLASHKLPLKTKIIVRDDDAKTEAGGEEQ